MLKKNKGARQEFEKATVVTNNIDDENLKELNLVDFCSGWKKQEQIFGKTIIKDIWLKNDKGDLVRSKQKRS